MLPIICESVVSIAVGCPVVRSELQKPLDSYQEDDLNKLKEKWSEALAKRKKYLDRQLTNILQKSAKTEAENEREQLLVDQCVFLTEEQEYVMVPAPGSGVPGAPADNEPPEGLEQHTPVLFLDLNSDDLSTGYGETGEVPVYGTHSILPKEHGAKSFALPIVRHLTREVGAIATWDSSIHDSVCLNTVTSGNIKMRQIKSRAVISGTLSSVKSMTLCGFKDKTAPWGMGKLVKFQFMEHISYCLRNMMPNRLLYLLCAI